MIEQTEMIVAEWHFHEPSKPVENESQFTNLTSLDVQRKRNAIKKGIAFRFTCHFKFEHETILEYIGEDTYVIDFEEVIDKNELLKMIRNSFSKFREKFDFRKMGTVLQNQTIQPLNEAGINLDAMIPLLI
ncbi:MAG: hypothetical protein RLZZ28_564 [Bacteroidota bacterium]